MHPKIVSNLLRRILPGRIGDFHCLLFIGVLLGIVIERQCRGASLYRRDFQTGGRLSKVGLHACHKLRIAQIDLLIQMFPDIGVLFGRGDKLYKPTLCKT